MQISPNETDRTCQAAVAQDFEDLINSLLNSNAKHLVSNGSLLTFITKPDNAEQAEVQNV